MSEATVEANKKRQRVSQSDVPAYSLEHAMRIPTAIAENYASKPTKPLDVAAAMNLQPSSSQFRMLAGAAIAYGLTSGGYNADAIELTPLARKILRPLAEGQDMEGKREALLKPKIVNEFLTKYDGSPLPKDNIAQNVLISMGVPDERVGDVLSLIVEGAEGLGLIREIKGKKYVNLHGSAEAKATQNIAPDPIYTDEPEEADASVVEQLLPGLKTATQGAGEVDSAKTKRVFITHGKNKGFVEPIKKLLAFGELEPVVSVEKQSVSQPVPEKVLSDMRSCGAAIIHVEDELRLLDKDAKEQVVLNPNVLIEIGAAMALYGKRFILLVKEGVSLPSNLQGLYEVRYSGEALDGNATIRLLEAINDMKRQPTAAAGNV